jgi:hypothetical protein
MVQITRNASPIRVAVVPKEAGQKGTFSIQRRFSGDSTLKFVH